MFSQILINSIIIFGVWKYFEEDNCFDWWIHKPLVSCRSCMSSVWGSVGYLCFNINGTIEPQMLILHVLGVFGLSVIIYPIIDVIYDMRIIINEYEKYKEW